MARRNRLVFARPISAAVCLLAVSGCFDSGVTWLPNSSGFIYTGLGNTTQVRHFDPAARKSRVVVEDTKAPTCWPAVSPDGKQIAVARVVHSFEETSRSMQIIRYDLNGKELHRSTVFPWHKCVPAGGNPGDHEWEGTTSLFWSPQGDKLIVTDSFEQIPSGTAIYDIAKDRLTLLNGHVLVIGGTPIRPDGKLFLLWNYEKLALVSMDGKEQRLPHGRLLDDDKRDVLRLDLQNVSRWENNTAVVAGATADLRIDTVKRAVTLTDIAPHRMAVDYAFPEGGANVRGLRSGGIAILKPGMKKAHAVSKSGQYLFLPSPDQKWLALRGMSRGSKILVIDRRGDVVAELPN